MEDHRLKQHGQRADTLQRRTRETPNGERQMDTETVRQKAANRNDREIRRGV